MNIYQNWNFLDNPFQTTSLPARIEGENLIAGRDEEIQKLSIRLYNQPQIPTIEGQNGIGKTSVINVTTFKALKSYLNDGKRGPLFVPCNSSFQLNENTNPDDFIDSVFIEIAQTIINHKDTLEKLNRILPSNIDEISNWLNSPFAKSYSGSFGLATFQVGGGETKETNTSSGFERSGFRRAVKNWLNKIFPNKNSGGIVCVIDNLELLEKSQAARQLIEELRDLAFNIHGIRWIMCGSLGIVSSIVSSPRLEGSMHDPIQIGGIKKEFLSKLFQNRINAFKKNQEYYLPITKQSFELLYEVLRENIRNTLKYSNDYCIWIADKSKKPIMRDEKENLFMEWITDKSKNYKEDVVTKIKPKTFNLFKDAIKFGGNFSLGQYELFDYRTPAIMRNCVKSLESVGLVISVIDENDNRRKSIQITPKGWFVNNAM